MEEERLEREGWFNSRGLDEGRRDKEGGGIWDFVRESEKTRTFFLGTFWSESGSGWGCGGGFIKVFFRIDFWLDWGTWWESGEEMVDWLDWRLKTEPGFRDVLVLSLKRLDAARLTFLTRGVVLKSSFSISEARNDKGGINLKRRKEVGQVMVRV